tara:strand:+ start:13661 stop:14206 length:546 start_codon:yes stop_codon:yes gene_type:complete
MSMDKVTPSRIAGNRLLFFALAMIGVFILLVPVSLTPGIFVWPEIMLLISCALVIRRPEYAPYWLIGFVFLISDFLLVRPIGLGAFIALLATEFLRRNRPAFVEMMFLSEWLGIFLLLLSAGVLRSVILFLTLAERIPLWAFGAQIGLSVVIYPLVVAFVGLVFKVTKIEETISHPVRRTV